MNKARENKRYKAKPGHMRRHRTWHDGQNVDRMDWAPGFSGDRNMAAAATASGRIAHAGMAQARFQTMRTASPGALPSL